MGFGNEGCRYPSSQGWTLYLPKTRESKGLAGSATLGCVKRALKSVQVLFHDTEAVMVVALIILKQRVLGLQELCA